MHLTEALCKGIQKARINFFRYNSRGWVKRVISAFTFCYTLFFCSEDWMDDELFRQIANLPEQLLYL